MNEKNSHQPNRREALRKMAMIPAAGVASVSVLRSFEEKCLAEETQNQGAEGVKKESIQGESGATRTSFTPPKRPHLKEKVPMSRIGNLNVSRMILGGNLIGGWAHARDLIYVSDLIKAYHTEQKVYETFYLAEQCGINTFLGHYSLFNLVKGYWKWTKGKMQFIADLGCQPDDLLDTVKRVIDMEPNAGYIQGGTADRIATEGKWDLFPKAIELLRDAGLPCGIGAHRVGTLKAAESTGVKPDFWMKTYHHQNYWSARPDEESHDNNWCLEPEETREWMKDRKEAWIAFKVLAAGALRPEDGFRNALEAGADFLCVGMYDFQLVQDVNTFCSIWNSDLKRDRPFMTPTLDRKELLKEEREASKNAGEDEDEESEEDA